MKDKIVKIQKFNIKLNKCFKCNLLINKNRDNFIKLITLNDGEIIEEVWFHIKCWSNYNSERLQNEMLRLAKQGMNMLNIGNLM